MGSDTENAIHILFNTVLDIIQQAIEASNERGSIFTYESAALLYYYFQKKETINPKNEKDNKCFQWSIISVLNHNKIKEKELKKNTKI